MRRKLFAVVLFVVVPVLAMAQQTMTNESVIKLVKAGLSDDLIINTINASPGTYNVSADGIIALKQAGTSDKVVEAIVTKTSSNAAAPVAPVATSQPQESGQATPQQPAGPSGSQTPAQTPASTPRLESPRVFLQSESKGSQWNAARDQSMEMSKDFERECPSVRVTISQNAADYTVLLNHIEHGFARDNQFQVANRAGDLISKTKEGGSIAGGVKKACQVILDDWAKAGDTAR